MTTAEIILTHILGIKKSEKPEPEPEPGIPAGYENDEALD